MSRLELRVVLVDHAVPPPLASPATRLLAVDVGTDFDPKAGIYILSNITFPWGYDCLGGGY